MPLTVNIFGLIAAMATLIAATVRIVHSLDRIDARLQQIELNQHHFERRIDRLEVQLASTGRT